MMVGTTRVCMLGLGSDLFHCLHTNDVVRSIPVDEVSRVLKAVLQAVCSPIVATQWDSLAVSPPKLHPTCSTSQTVDHIDTMPMPYLEAYAQAQTLSVLS